MDNNTYLRGRIYPIKKWLIVLALCVLVICIICWWVAGRLISPAQRDVAIPATTHLPIEKFSISSESGATLAGWHIDADNTKGVIILLHGIRGTRLSMLKRAELLYQQGYSIVLIDLQAHGESIGDNITIGYLEKHDVLAAIDYAKEIHRGEPIGIIGTSLGGASAVLASPQNIDALILESVYSDIRTAIHNRVRKRLGVFSWLPAQALLAQLKPRLGIDISALSPINAISSITSPVFIISGVDDIHTTQQETESLYTSANQPKKLWLVDNVSHQDIYRASPELYEKNIVAFLAKHMRSQ